MRDGFLVPMQAVSVPLKFQREGIRYDQLSSEETRRLGRAGMGRGGRCTRPRRGAGGRYQWLFNADTVDRVLAHLMTHGQRVEGGDRLGKTIIFAKNQAHAEVHPANGSTCHYPHAEGQLRAGDPQQGRPRAEPDRRLLGTGPRAAHRDQRGHARHRHRRARGGQPRPVQAGALEDQVLADDRPRHPAAPEPVRRGAGQDVTSRCSISARTSNISARTCRRSTAACPTASRRGCSRPVSAWSARWTICSARIPTRRRRRCAASLPRRCAGRSPR